MRVYTKISVSNIIPVKADKPISLLGLVYTNPQRINIITILNLLVLLKTLYFFPKKYSAITKKTKLNTYESSNILVNDSLEKYSGYAINASIEQRHMFPKVFLEIRKFLTLPRMLSFCLDKKTTNPPIHKRMIASILLNLSCVLCTTCPKSIYHLGDNV